MRLVRFLSDSFAQFMVGPVIGIYLIVAPIIDLASDKDDINCHNNDTAEVAHSVLFAIFLLIAFVHALCVWAGLMDEPLLQQNVRRTFKLKVGNQEMLGKFVGNFLEVVIVSYWAIFAGPEPLSCWILIVPEEYSGFQGARVAIFAGIGLVLYAFISFCHYHGSSAVPLAEESTKNEK